MILVSIYEKKVFFVLIKKNFVQNIGNFEERYDSYIQLIVYVIFFYTCMGF